MSLFSKLSQVKDLREQAKKMQNTLSQEIIEIENHGIKVKMDGNQNILSVNIPDGMQKPDLEKYMPEAFNDAVKKLQKLMAEKMRRGEITMPDFKF
jgi:DNA-binding protein YbaB